MKSCNSSPSSKDSTSTEGEERMGRGKVTMCAMSAKLRRKLGREKKEIEIRGKERKGKERRGEGDNEERLGKQDVTTDAQTAT